MTSPLQDQPLPWHANAIFPIASSPTSANDTNEDKDQQLNEKDASTKSGYSADKESVAKPTRRIQLNFKHKRPTTTTKTNSENDSKWRRSEESQYDVHNTRLYLTKAGRPYPKIHVGRSRVIPFGSVDMSKVTLVVSSKDMGATPFITEALPEDKCHFDFAKDYGKLYTDLFGATIDSYKSPQSRSGGVDSVPEDASTSSDSSMTLSDSECDDAPSQKCVIKPRLEIGVSPEEKNSDNGTIEASPHCDSSSSCVPSLSIEEALTPLSKPRILTQSVHPHTIVHVNAAYSRMTGKNANSVVGQSLTKILTLSTGKKISLGSCVAASGAEENITAGVIVCNNKSDNTKEKSETSNRKNVGSAMSCSMKVVPIVACTGEAKCVTHYSVDLEAYATIRGGKSLIHGATVVGW